MQRFNRLIALAVALSPVPGASQTVCSADEVQVTSLGIDGLACDNCTQFRSDDPRDWRWEFGSEPEVISVDDGGPAAGSLRAGDVIVAVDDYLITTQQGGRRFTRPAAGRSVSLRARRDNREFSVSIRPRLECEKARREASAIGVRSRATAIDSVHVSPGVTSIYPSAARAVTLPMILPEGWLGLSFECSRCQVQILGDSTRVWSFAEPPSIVTVESTGPAARAGLRSGDRIVSVDGIGVTTAAGGERFGSIAPGESIAIGYRRGGTTGTVDMVVGTRSRSATGIGSSGTRVSTSTSVRTVESDVVRYSGRIGDTMIEVTGEPVTVTQTERETIIQSSSIRVRLRRADGGR